jgi:hypothetical protein
VPSIYLKAQNPVMIFSGRLLEQGEILSAKRHELEQVVERSKR